MVKSEIKQEYDKPTPIQAQAIPAILDGKDIYTIGLNNYRQLTSAVMQGDDLLSGSIGDNISFFAIEQDMQRLEKVAKDAVIFDDIKHIRYTHIHIQISSFLFVLVITKL